MWLKKHILYQTLCCALVTMFVYVCSTCTVHTYTHLFPDLKSFTLTPGVSVESGWAALPLTEISTCCLSAASACFIFDRNQSGRHKPSSAYYVFECTPTVHTKCMHSHNHKPNPAWCFFDGKQSAKTERNNLTERENVTVCIQRPCTFDTCEWSNVIEAYFEGKGRTIIKACFWKHRGISAQDVLSDWKQIGFITNVTSHDLTKVVFDFCECMNTDCFHL